MATESPAILPVDGATTATNLALPPGLRAVILLGGSVRPSRLAAAIGRSIADLPVSDGRAIIDTWRDQAENLAERLGAEKLAVRFMINPRSISPALPLGTQHCEFTIEQDPLEYRGTGGVLHDVLKNYADDDLVLVVAALQIPFEPLDQIVARLWQPQASVTLLAPRDGTPCGFILMRCGCIRDVPAEGFIDLKEQALPKIAQKHTARVVYETRPSALPVRTLDDYIQGLRRHHRDGVPGDEASAWEGDVRSTFALIESGAMVHPDARVHDSVVLKGARLEAGAVVVRSIVCDGQVVRKDTMAVDQLVAATDRGVEA